MTETTEPDVLDRAAKLLSGFSKGQLIAVDPDRQADAAIVLASAVLAVAAEIRSIHNLLVELNSDSESDGSAAL